MRRHLNEQIPNTKSWACMFNFEQYIKTLQPKAYTRCCESPVDNYFCSWSNCFSLPYCLAVIWLDVTFSQGKQIEKKKLLLTILGGISFFFFFYYYYYYYYCYYSFSFFFLFFFFFFLSTLPPFFLSLLPSFLFFLISFLPPSLPPSFLPPFSTKEESSVVKWNEEGHWSKVNLCLNAVSTTYCNSVALGKYLPSLSSSFPIYKQPLQGCCEGKCSYK